MTTLEQALSPLPFVAILRGIEPREAIEMAQLLYDCGFRCIEVPLNSPDPFESIRLMSEALPDDCITGAGTVLRPADVDKVREAGGTIIVTPNMNPEVIRATVASNMIAVPGVGTATEAFAAIEAGAKSLKLFPAATYGTGHLKALSSVLPKEIRVVATGGVGSNNLKEWLAAGAAGFGIGSELYKAGRSKEEVRANAQKLCAAMPS